MKKPSENIYRQCKEEKLQEAARSQQPARTSTLAKWFSLDITSHEGVDKDHTVLDSLPQEPQSDPDQKGHPFCYLWSTREPGPYTRFTGRAESDLGSLRDMAVVKAQLPSWRDLEKQGRLHQTGSQVVPEASSSLARPDTSNQRCQKRRRRTLEEPEKMCSTPESSTTKGVTYSWACVLVMLLSCGVAFISYLDRAILGVTILPMAAELGWDESFEGAISR